MFIFRSMSSKTKKNTSADLIRSPCVQGQLTGIPRQVKDTVADIHNYVLKWQKLTTRGFEELSNLSDIKLTLLSNSENNESGFYSNDLLEICNKIVVTYNELEKTSKKLGNFASKLAKLEDLSDYNSSSSMSCLSSIPFVTWPVSKFTESATEISEMHVKELSLKKSIVENAAHVDCFMKSKDPAELIGDCRNTLMTFSSCWLHEPYIDVSARKFLIQSMIFESGHER
ncbi:cyclin-dependent kinase 2-interacting protein-like [Ciona intestinalis]